METVNEFLHRLVSQGVKLSAQAGQLSCYAQKGALTRELREGIVRFKPELIALLESRSATEPQLFPLSAGQKGLYILQKLQPASSAYNVPLCFRFNADVDARVLAAAWDRVLDRFPILTARVVERDGAPYQQTDVRCRTMLGRRDIAFTDDEQLLSFLRSEAKQPFDLFRGPLTRIELFVPQNRKPILLLTVHHIVFDGASAVIVLKSLLELYQQIAEGKPARAQQAAGYQEFVAWEESMLSSAEGAAHARYWQKQLDAAPQAVELLPDVPPSSSADAEGKTLAADLPEDLCRWAAEFSKAHSVPPSVIFLGLFQLLLHRYTNQDDVIVGMPVMGRAAQRFAMEVGYFINMVPLRARCGGAVELIDFLRKVQGTMLDALYHSSYPFPLMIENLTSARREKSAIFRVSYAYQNFVDAGAFLSLLQQQKFQLENVAGIWQEGDFDFGLEIYEGRASSFNVHIKYNPARYTPAMIAGFFESYCTLLRAVSANPGRTVNEYAIASEPAALNGVVDPARCLHELFAEQVAHHANDAAVVRGDERLTYQQLHDRSRDLAMHLQSLGIGPDGLVGICMSRSLDLVVGLFGILQAGGAYVALDADDPTERLTHIVRDSGAAIVLTEQALREKLGGSGARLIAVSERSENAEPLRHDVRPHHLALVTYTSDRKRVAFEHRSPATLAQWARGVYGSEAVPASSSIASDRSAVEILVTLANGGTVVLDADTVAPWIDGVFHGAAEGALYGGIDGRPVANARLSVLDRHQHPQPVGAIGELYISGAGLARAQERVQAGQAARRLSDGTIESLGRTDTQVVIDGFRIELGEIETRLRQHPMVQDGAVIAHGRQLVAFYQPKESAQVSEDELRAELTRTLPQSMMPAQFVSVAAIVDRPALAEMLLKRQLAYWQDKLANLPDSLELPSDSERPVMPGPADATHEFTLDAQLTAKLESLAKRRGGSLFTILLAAVNVLLHRYTGKSDICVGTAIETNTLALRSQVDGEDTFSSLLSQVRTTSLEAHRHQDVPFEDIADMLHVRSTFEVIVAMGQVTGHCDLGFAFTATADGVTGTLQYRTAMYKAQRIARMADHFVALCRAIAATPTARIRNLEILGEVEQQQLLVEFNATEAATPAGQCIHQMLDEQVQRTPDTVAVICGEQTLSYQQLSDKSRDLALQLQSLGVQPDNVVALCVERSLDLMVGVLGIVQAGAAYLLADPADSDDRIAYMLQDARTAIVVTQDRFRHRLRSLLPANATLTMIDAPSVKAKRAELRRDVKPENLCSVVYPETGSGKPKGVAMEHKALASQISAMQRRHPLHAGDAVAAQELFWPLIAGASLLLGETAGSSHSFYRPAEIALAATVDGAPLGNTRIYILDRYGRPQPIGIPGELHIAGDGLARGYLHLPKATQESFVANPFVPGTRMFKTGELARRLDDGKIQHLGSKR